MNPLTIADLIRHWARRTPDRPMLSCEGRTVTWRQQDLRSNQVAQGLLAKCVKPGSRVAFLDKNGLEYFDWAFAAAKVNAVFTPINWRLSPREMAGLINDSEAEVLFVGSEFSAHLAAFDSELQGAPTIITADRYDTWRERWAPEDPGAKPATATIAMQLYTSGTTGLPKGAMLANETFSALCPVGAAEFGIDADSVSMVALPLFHMAGAGWALLGLANGAHTVVIREFDPQLVLRTIEDHRISHAGLVPAAIGALVAVPEAATTDFSSLECIVYGASPISETVLMQALATMQCDFVQLYGLTETGLITLLRAKEHQPDGPHPERLRSCGEPFAHVELRVVDVERGQEQPVGVPGELWARSAQNMKGYWRNPEATAATITADGWLRTGDIASIDGHGFVYLLDRVKDMIISGGENIYPAEVENVLIAHPAVADVAVIGVPSERWGEAVQAIVVRAPGGMVTEEELIAFARDRIAHYKCPSAIDFCDLLPRTATGKVLKRELRERHWSGANRQIH